MREGQDKIAPPPIFHQDETDGMKAILRKACYGCAVLFVWATTSTTIAAAEPSDLLIDVQRGTLPIVMSAPHGGTIDAPGVPHRKNIDAERFVTGIDGNTLELAHKIADAVEKELGGKPYFTFARFRRRHLDANRSAEHAYEVPAAKLYYDEYHGTLTEFCREVQNKFGAGLFIDVHGQNAYPDEVLVGTVGGETVKLLRQRFGDESLVGRNGVVGFLRSAGLKTMPAIDATEFNLPRFNGGYTVQSYGSHKPIGIDAVQFEYGGTYRQTEKLDDTAKRTAAAIAKFYREYLPQKPQAEKKASAATP